MFPAEAGLARSPWSRQRGADMYELVANRAHQARSKDGPGMCRKLNKYYVGVPARDAQPAQILVYDVAP